MMPPKKPLRLYEAQALNIRECDSIELDSLENDSNCQEDSLLSKSNNNSSQELTVLSLKNNDIQIFPPGVLQLTTLTVLDLSVNRLLTLPPEISQLHNLEELILDQNLLSVLPATLWHLRCLKILKVASNRLTVPPDKPPEMRALILAESELNPENNRRNANDGLTTLNLRANRLKGHIILGSYSSLTELDVSENAIEILDLGAVEQLRVLQCSRNSLTQLTLFGKNLVSVIAGNNKLKSFATTHPPIKLSHFDVSYNDLRTLPDWLSGCAELRSLFAGNNAIATLPDHLFCSEMPLLQTVQLANNRLQSLPTIQRRLPIEELFLQNNSLSSLPEGFFKFVPNIRVMNVSNNRLIDLPRPDAAVLVLEKLFLTANCLIDKSLDKIAMYLKNLKILHIAYNNLTSLPTDCALHWSEIEELVLSGNKLLRLPDNFEKMRHLAVLRVHSNLLQCVPKLSGLTKLRVLDLAHNQLDRVDLKSLIPPNLKFLDLSCNVKLHVDCQQFNTYRTQRPMSLVDVSGRNRTSLPSAAPQAPFCETDLTDDSWSVGFSETSGSKAKLHLTQIRLPAFCNTEALFGIFDGEKNNFSPTGVDKLLPRILLEERTVKETAHDYMKYTMLSTFRHLKSKGINAVICHILKPKQLNTEFIDGFSEPNKKYLMKIASIGDMKLVIGQSDGPVRLLPARGRFPATAPPTSLRLVQDPEVAEIWLDERDEYMVLANKNLWDVMTPANAVKEVSLQRNVILAAKRLQDLAQSYGAEENLSIIVVKFNLHGSDVDLLMRELRQTIKKNKYGANSVCQSGCCCCHEKIPPPMAIGDDRSSPSGQSEHACSDCNSSGRFFTNQLAKTPENRLFRSVTPSLFEAVEVKISPERRSYRGVAKALKQRRGEEDRVNKEADSDSALSEEQFKCWEYMLEQNTQLLFDKELNNTLNRSTRAKTPSNLSRSSPHLAISDSNNNGPFLSKQFGSSRSFNPSRNRATSDRNRHLIGGPNAAYFGSLQRLMPYNLEYDFAVMHERGLVDSIDLDRMQQYWGVATTEL